MAVVKLQSEFERQKGVFYQFDPSEQPLGEGGMGKVFRGKCVDEQRGYSRDVAIKFMYNDLPDHVIERARREASIQLRNDNLVEMLGFVEIEEEGVLGEIKKRYHVVSELLEGVCLDDLLEGKTVDQYGRSVPFAEKLYHEYKTNPYKFGIFVVRNVLSGLMALHDAGYIHRDIDPTNIMVTRDGHIKLIDFGIAKQINALGTHDKAVTTAGVFMGKPWYAAPELVLGDVKFQNKTTDVYAVGIMLYQLCLGKRPFDGSQHEVLEMQLKKPMPLKEVAHRDIKAIIDKATRKKQPQRYQSAAEFRVDLEKVKPISVAENGRSGSTVNKGYIFGGIGAVAIVIAAILVLNRPNTEPIPIVPEEKEVKVVVHRPTYKEVYTLLTDVSTAHEAMKEMQSLADNGDSDAAYLLSRLYFSSKRADDYESQDVKTIKANLNLASDNVKAHQYLKMAVRNDDKNYKALYELGCDYLGGAGRTDAVSRNIGLADSCFQMALRYAQNDHLYKEMINAQIKKYNK